MHVLMTTDTVGGVWTYACDLVSGYLRRGVDVCLVALGRRFLESHWNDVRLLSNTGPGKLECISANYKLEWMEDCQKDLTDSAEFLCRLIDDRQPDVLHLNQFCYGALPVDIPKVVVAHSDVISWWRAVHGADPEDSEWIRSYRRIVSNGLQGADVVIAPTSWLAYQLREIYGDTVPIQVIANGSNPASFGPTKEKRLRAVSVGRVWDEGKHVRMLERVQTTLPIYIAGDLTAPSGKEILHPESSNHGLHYLGFLAREDVHNLMATSAIYIVTSRYEPFGLAPVEAALCGCAIVANDIPSLREIWGDSILYFERNNPDALSYLLNRMAVDERATIQAGRRAQAYALSCLSNEQMTERYLRLYGEHVRERSCQ